MGILEVQVDKRININIEVLSNTNTNTNIHTENTNITMNINTIASIRSIWFKEDSLKNDLWKLWVPGTKPLCQQRHGMAWFYSNPEVDRRWVV